jgi:hypothetical protein
VSKQFSDSNPADVGVTITCNTGLPLEQNATIAQGDGVTFVVTDFEADTMDCEVTESPVPEGYGAAYSTNGGFTFPSFESCVYEDVGFGAENTCLIVNDLDQVLVEVSKSWIDENPGFDHVNYAEAQFDCQNEQYGIHAFGILEFVGDDAVDGFFVFPRWDGTTSCTITETVVEGGVDFDDTECQQLQVLPGSGASCTLYNTRLYEGIPTLSQYGLALLALLMLGMGLVGYRRIA